MYRAPRGTTDILPEEQKYWSYVRFTAEKICKNYGYSRLDTPIFEQTDLFVRGVGEVTDIVEKEMYSFLDRGGDYLTLRPEGTASVCRAYLEHGMHNLPQPVRLFYFSPTFRYERPQAGRFRQHHQFGVEVLGESDASIDVEIIDMAWRFMNNLGLNDLNLLINSIGDKECRPNYLSVLKAYYEDKIGNMCKDCKQRMIRNPLRLLDCKQDFCSLIAANAPRSIDCLCIACLEHWENLVCYLTKLEIPFTIEPRLVRGLDYYTRTVFEIQPQDAGSQSTICAGGRYDGLIEELRGQTTPGIGFAAGIERIILALKNQNVDIGNEEGIRAVVAYMGEEAKEKALILTSVLHRKGISAVIAPDGKSLRAQMRYANNIGAAYAVVIGEEELKNDTVVIRDMNLGDQRNVKFGSVEYELGVILDKD